MPTFKPFWKDINTLSEKDLIFRITNNVDPKDFKANVERLESFELDRTKPLQILDFGAGMLRNTVALANMSPLWTVTAYDHDDMLKRGIKHYEPLPLNVILANDWDAIKDQKFDHVIAILVLQHISTVDIKAYIKDIYSMTPSLIVHGRQVNDDDEDNIWGLIFTHFMAERCMERSIGDLFEGDINTHSTVLFRPGRDLEYDDFFYEDRIDDQ